MNLKPESIKKLKAMSAKCYWAEKVDVNGKRIPYPRPNYWRKVLERGTYLLTAPDDKGRQFKRWRRVTLRDLVRVMRIMIKADDEKANGNSKND